MVEPLKFKLVQHTDSPRYSRTFICEFAYSHCKEIVQNDNFPVKMAFFICEFKIRGPKRWKVSTANNEGYLYLEFSTPAGSKNTILYKPLRNDIVVVKVLLA